MVAAAADTFPSITNTLARPWRPSAVPRQQIDATATTETAQTESSAEVTEKVGKLLANHLYAFIDLTLMMYLVDADPVARLPPTNSNVRS